MYDCPRCNGVETLRYNLYYDVFICVDCGIAAQEDCTNDTVVVDYVTENNRLVAVSEYICPIEDVPEAEVNLEFLRKHSFNSTSSSDSSAE